MRANINGIDIAYDDHGIGQPVVFLHAFPLHRGMWADQITALLQEQRYRLVALDWRGFGESGIDTSVTTMEQCANDLAGLLDRLGIQQAILCGLSMGGYIAFAFLRAYAERVQGLILADTRPGADNEEGKAAREKLVQLVESQGTDAVADLQLPRLLSPETRQRSPEVELRARQMINAATATGIAAASRGMAQRIDATELLASIACPTLVIVGEQDALISPSVAQDYAAQIPGAQCVVIPRAGHLTNLEQPAVFLHTVRHFLQTSF